MLKYYEISEYDLDQILTYCDDIEATCGDISHVKLLEEFGEQDKVQDGINEIRFNVLVIKETIENTKKDI